MLRAAVRIGMLSAALAALPVSAMAQDGAVDGAATAWVLTSTALVLFMTLPGLALFYGGLVGSRNVLSVLMHCFAIACLASVLWLLCGYGLAFGDGGSMQAWIGGLDRTLLAAPSADALVGGLPESVFFMFQMTFAIITPALIVGAYPERIRFSAVLIFSGIWLLVVYVPAVHWIWGGGWLAEMGVMDFAGGLVVHATAGSSAVLLAIMLGRRQGFPGEPVPPHSPGMTMAGAAMLWVGWYGFNGGSALAAGAGAGMAITVTHVAAAAAALTWMTIEWVRFGKPSLIGTVTGMVAGLATITPGSGFVGPAGGLVYGVLGSGVCFLAVQLVKQRLRIDDSLDVFAVHGVGGLLGTLLTGIFAASSFGGIGLADGTSIADQLWTQVVGAAAVVVWSLVATYVIVKVTAALTGLRVDPQVEAEGLDLSEHGERGYNI
ncbi:MAG: ammonium transporter [Alphaproteobacteria bacterium]